MYRRFQKPPVKKASPKNINSIVSPSLDADYKEAVCAQSYLGKKGYTIPKSVLTEEDTEYLKSELYVKPQVFGAIGAGAAEATSFPVFRENTNKLYLPRFYGIQRYGLPPRSEIDAGDDIDLTFVKPLRDYQDKIIGVYTDYVDTPISGGGETSPAKGGGGILEVPCGRGKCLGRDTPILMSDGTVKMVQDVRVGDLLMGDDSKPRKVLSLARGIEKMVHICQDNSDFRYVTNMSHILSLKHAVTGEILDLSIEQYLSSDYKDDLLGYRVPIQFPETPMDSLDGYKTGYYLNNYTNVDTLNAYIRNSRRIQLQLLAGIVDRNHYVDETVYRICLSSSNNVHKSAVLYLTRSLGFETNAYYSTDNNNYFIDLKSTPHARLDEIPARFVFMNMYNKEALVEGNLTYKISVKPVRENEYYGFEIDGNRRFVLGDFTVTHNTVMALKIISLIKKKTLIIVHKEFLMNQWIERIGEFLPSARVGKIQGPTFDVDRKDIVIGMLQSLYDREFPVDAFSCFGLTIVDEVHRIGSEQFSRSLFKIITPYMLGISATVDRKDKLTKVLYMFIGDKIYTEKREDEDLVCVRSLQYVTNDPEFNDTEYDFRGSPKYSTMITKLCAFAPRSDFIVRVIGDLLKESDNQIMILAHNRSLLTYLYEAIQYKRLASVGYYVGGMKQSALQTTESKEVVLATYAMAAEALDIKTLSTLVMVTPKTDIIQSVGRILRVRHENPIVVDIVDSHDLFQNQWTQRKRFYKKCNYKIIETTSTKYKNMDDIADETVWKKVFEPKEVSKNVASLCVEDDKLESQKEIKQESKCLINIGSLIGLDDPDVY
jgi:superfamily II DNA or RNA helicase